MMGQVDDVLFMWLLKMLQLTQLITKAINISVFTNAIDPIPFGQNTSTDKVSCDHNDQFAEVLTNVKQSDDFSQLLAIAK